MGRIRVALWLVVVSSWVFVLIGPSGMGVGPLVFVGAWTIMMIAMMIPSAAPLILLFRQGATGRGTAALVAGYVVVWAAAGVPAWVAQESFPMSWSPVALAMAGIYQFTPLKDRCLSRCRSPADFLMQRWGRGAFRLGVEHGVWCLGCCWALMAVLVVVGMMGLAWVVGLAALVAVEKISAQGVLVARISGAVFLATAIAQGVS